jgi:hypothetical protein
MHSFIHLFLFGLVWNAVAKKNHIQNCAYMTFELLSLTQGARITCLFICLLVCLLSLSIPLPQYSTQIQYTDNN